MRSRCAVGLPCLLIFCACAAAEDGPTNLRPGDDTTGNRPIACDDAAIDLTQMTTPSEVSSILLSELRFTGATRTLFPQTQFAGSDGSSQLGLPVEEVEVAFCLPSDTLSVALMVDQRDVRPASAAAFGSVLFSGFRTPSDEELIPAVPTLEAYAQVPARPFIGLQEVNVLYHAKDPGRRPLGGQYTVALASDQAVALDEALVTRLRAVVRRGSFQDEAILPLHVVVLADLLELLTTNERRLLENLPDLLGSALVEGSTLSLDSDHFAMSSVDDPSVDGLIRLDAPDNGQGELEALTQATTTRIGTLNGGEFNLPQSEESEALHIYFVEAFVFGAGDSPSSVAGVASGIPGAPTVSASATNGVFVALGALLDSNELLSPTLLRQVVTHEVGHWLGLHHTTESSGTLHDVIADTPECPSSADVSGQGNNPDGLVDARECEAFDSGNLMFWSPPPSATALSAAQSAVLGAFPVGAAAR